MTRIRLIHWNDEEGKLRSAELEKLRYQVNSKIPTGPRFFKELAEEMPDAVVIDLSRLPSQGRDLAIGIRRAKSTRKLPLVFAGGVPAKVDQIRELLPDAAYADWSKIRKALEQGVSSPPEHPVVPESSFAGYSGTPLPKKLGIKPHMTVGLLNPPEDFQDTLGSLPEGAELERNVNARCDLVICFVGSRRELSTRVLEIADRRDLRSAWIAWPKKTSGVQSDLTQQLVRDSGLARGLVDYKICSIDSTWSGLLFTHRKK